MAMANMIDGWIVGRWLNELLGGMLLVWYWWSMGMAGWMDWYVWMVWLVGFGD